MTARSRRARALALLAIAWLACPVTALAARQSLFDGALRLGGFTHQSIEFQVPGAWMRNPRLEGHIDAAGGGGNDVELLVLHREDFPNWEKHQPFTPVFDAGRGSSIDLDVALPGAGAYVIVLSNRFSKVSAKQITGSLSLSWDEDPSLPEGGELREQVHFLNPPKHPDRFAVRVSAHDSTALVVFERDGEDGPYAISARRREHGATVSRPAGTYTGDIEEVGTSDLHGDGTLDAFVVGASGDDGRTRDLIVVCSRTPGTIRLSLVPGGDGTAITERPGPDYAKPQFSVEQSFIERIKSVYGAERPDTAGDVATGGGKAGLFVDWMRDNGGLRDGPMTIRRLPGPPAGFGEPVARVSSAGVVYTAHRGYGVVAWEPGTREHFAVFHPADRDAWPTALVVEGPWLVIGTHGEGLAFVHTRTFRLRRVRPGGETDTVRTLEIVDGAVRVNGVKRVDLPAE